MPPTIWTLAATGTLTKGSLLDELDKDPGLLDREDGSGITPLGYALINGKTNVVKLLLENQANPDKVMGESMPFPDGRTPAFLAASAKKGSARMMQLLLKKNPKSFDKPIASNKDQTPLMMAIRAQNTEVVKMLMEKGASVDKRRTDGKSPIDLAKALQDGSKKTAIQAALQPNLKGGGGLRTYVKSWAVRVLGRFKIFKPLGSILKGATRYFQKLAPPIEPDDDYGVKEPETIADFKEHLNNAVADGNLEKFFPPGDSYLDEVAQKAAGLKKDPDNILNDPSQIQGLATLALYQTVLYCDDSYSMREENRWPRQTELATRTADIAIQSVPNLKGVHFRFINKGTSNTDDLKGDGVAAQIRDNAPNGSTPIGTQLREKILKPLIYSSLDAGTKLVRPYLVMIMTDGCPWDENVDELRNSILDCGKRLKAAGYRKDAVRFCLSQIGTDDDARAFLDSLDMDDDVGEVLYRTAELLDAKYEELRENEKDLQSWLLGKLLTPLEILNAP